jgi:DNA-binding transcriptional MerR regulator
MDCHLSPTETARRFGVSIKALRLYEQRGLLAPLRSAAGWRTYGPDQVARLHQVLTLKRLGLPLARIAQLLAGPTELDAVLALQEQVLARQSQSVTRALALLRSARAKLATGAALSIDDLTNLTQETVMPPLSAKEMNRLITPFADRHISSAEKEVIKANVPDREQMARDYDALVAEARTLMQTENPTSPAAQDLAIRFVAFSKPFEDQPDLRTKGQAVWNDAMKDPVTAGKLAQTREIFAFVNQAIAHMKAQAK